MGASKSSKSSKCMWQDAEEIEEEDLVGEKSNIELI
jgi:hypothetical protein